MLFRSDIAQHPSADVRDIRLLEVTSAALTLRPVSDPSSSAFGGGSNALRYYGTQVQVQALAGRKLYLAHADGRNVELINTNAASDFSTPLPAAPRLWSLSFDRAPKPFTRADFDEAAPTVTSARAVSLQKKFSRRSKPARKASARKQPR